MVSPDCCWLQGRVLIVVPQAKYAPTDRERSPRL